MLRLTSSWIFFSDEKTWVGISTFIFSAASGLSSLLTAGAAIYGIGKMASKAIKAAAARRKKLKVSDYTLFISNAALAGISPSGDPHPVEAFGATSPLERAPAKDSCPPFSASQPSRWERLCMPLCGH